MAQKKKPLEITPIPQPDIVTRKVYRGRPWFRPRAMCLTMEDWRRIDDALRIACPYIRYYRDWTNEEQRGETPPPVKLTERISDQVMANGRMPDEVQMIFDPDWKLEFVPPGGRPDWWPFGSPAEYWTLKYSGGDLPNMRLRYPSAYSPASEKAPEHYYVDCFHLSIMPNHPGHIAFHRAFFSLLGKFASNRHQAMVDEWNTTRIFDPRERTNLWIGYDALRWLLEDPRRAIFHLQGVGWTRPIDEKWRGKLD